MLNKYFKSLGLKKSVLFADFWYLSHLHRKFVFFLTVTFLTCLPSVVTADLEEIIVTARKKAEGLQDTPISITALSGERLEDMGLTKITKLQDVTPNLVFQNTPTFSGAGNNAAVYIRGIGQRDFIPTIDPGVGIYVDEVYLGRSAGAVFDMIDIGQVEVLRGPQGTLFGRNTIGGAISISTTKPNDVLAGKLDFKIGTDSRQNFRGMINLPITESLFMRASAASMEQDGYVFRPFDGKDLGNQDYTMARVAFRWLASESITADVSFDYFDDKTNGPPMVITRVDDFPDSLNATAGGNFPFINNIFAGFGAAGPNPIPCTLSTAPASCFTTANVVTGNNTNLGTGPNFSEMENEAVSILLTWELDNMTAKLIGGYRSLDGSFASDRDGYPQADGDPWVPGGPPLMINPVTHYFDTFVQDQTSLELQLSGTSMDDRIDWVIGIYTFGEDGENINPVDFTPASIQSGGYFDYKSDAVFGQLTFRVTDSLDATFGVRYTKEDRDYTPDQFFEELPLGTPAFPCYSQAGDFKPCELGDRVVPYQTVNNKMSETTPMLNFAYTINDETMVYATYSEGFKVGGFNQRIFPPEPSLPTFDPEYVKSYEIGVKTELLNNDLRFNASVYVSDYTDLQLLIAEPSRVGPYITNAGEATIEGLELELTYVTPTMFFIDFAAGYTDAGYDELTDGALAGGLTVDSPFGFISDWNAHLSVSKSVDLSGGGTLTPRVDWTWRSGLYTNASGLPLPPPWADALYQPDYSVVNISISWESGAAGFKVTAGIENVGDEEYAIFGDYQPNFGSDAEAYDRGRQWYLMVGYEF
ncbi:MAG: TonB-dependent receptor [Porticoccaceae bacterium]|nr:TonB-dependent receptor [Porticoccaceae bacterium]